MEKKQLKFIGCEVVFREACYLAAVGPHQVDLQFLRKGLHDLETGEMLATIQAAIDAVDIDAGYDAILLGYARCNDGTVGLTARDIPLVIPRAHDCITFFFGSRQAYRRYFDEFPGTYYRTSGWMERNRCGEEEMDQLGPGRKGVMGKLGLNQSYEQLVSKHGRENADYILEMLGDWKKHYNKFLYLKMGLGDETPLIEETRREAKERDWDFELRDGDWTLLEKLFFGVWDDDFVIVPPGCRLAARNDEGVLDVEPE